MQRTPLSEHVAGILLAGGRGTRMRPLTQFANKHVLPVHMRPMIEYPLGTLLTLGLNDILVVTGRSHMGQIVDVLGSGSHYGEGVRFTYRVQDEARGIADALGLAEDFAAGRRLAVILGDNVFDAARGEEDDLRPLVQAFATAVQPHAVNILTDVEDPRAYGVARMEDGRIQEILEKPDAPPSNLAVTGLYLYPGDVFEVVSELSPSARGELEISDVNNHYAAAGRLQHHIVERWFDAGEPGPWMRTQSYVAAHPDRFGPERFRLRGGEA